LPITAERRTLASATTPSISTKILFNLQTRDALATKRLGYVLANRSGEIPSNVIWKAMNFV